MRRVILFGAATAIDLVAFGVLALDEVLGVDGITGFLLRRLLLRFAECAVGLVFEGVESDATASTDRATGSCCSFPSMTVALSGSDTVRVHPFCVCIPSAASAKSG